MTGSWVVIFTSTRTAEDAEGYRATAAQMEALAHAQAGFISMQSVRGGDGVGITLCYWESEQSIAAWKRNVDHATAQQQGKSSWYSDYSVTIAKVERQYGSRSPKNT
ncbi:MAG: antibiotic biosynthesis monooxygenase family protein [Steroidobacteraceae bacterium]|jgi:heme-degrading monooxygenase HmoA